MTSHQRFCLILACLFSALLLVLAVECPAQLILPPASDPFWQTADGKAAAAKYEKDAEIYGTPRAAYRQHGTALLNDLHATPGAVGNMTVAQLCAADFHTGTVRNVTEATKFQACALYGIARADCTGQKVEIDHLISLELGGTNDIANLWPQPYFPRPGAKEKDVVENWLHRQVCAGKMTLPAAQAAISTDWYQVYLVALTQH